MGHAGPDEYKLNVTCLFNMITDDPLGAAGILDEVKLHLVMIVKREVKL